MKRIGLRVPLVTAAAIAIGAVLAFALPAGANVSTESPPVAALRIEPIGTVSARGAVATITVTVVCMPGAFAEDVVVEVTQRSGSGIAQGQGFADVSACTGTFQTVDVIVPAEAGGEEFRKGTALARAQFFVCDFTCTSAFDQREVELARA